MSHEQELLRQLVNLCRGTVCFCDQDREDSVELPDSDIVKL